MTAQTPVGAPTNKIILAQATPNMNQPRQTFAPEPMLELAQSIRSGGLVQPIVVQPGDTYHAGKFDYTIVAGERRWRASAALAVAQHRAPGDDDILANFVKSVCQNPFSFLETHRALLEQTYIAATITDRADGARLLIRATVENLHRADLNQIELAAAYQKLSDDGMSDTEIARAVGLGDKARSTVANTRRLVNLPQDMKDAVVKGIISTSVALAYLPALDVQPHEIEQARPRLKKDPGFMWGDVPTPGALRKRLCNPDKYGGTINRDRVRDLVSVIKTYCTPNPCDNCGRNTRDDTIGKNILNRELLCNDCYRIELEPQKHPRWCRFCGTEQEINGFELAKNHNIYCSRCNRPSYAQSWLTVQPVPPEKPEEKHPESYSYCKSCGKVLARTLPNYKGYCVNCRDTLVTLYCPECGTSREMPQSRIDKGLRSNCKNCHAIYPADEWLKEPPAGRPAWAKDPELCACGAKLSPNDIRLGYTKCKACEQNGNGHHPATIAVIENPPPAPWEEEPAAPIPGECPACGHHQATNGDDTMQCAKCGSTNPTTLWAAEATPPADDDMPEWLKDDTPEATHAVKLVYRINQRWGLLLDHIPPARLAELDAWLDDIAAEFELETV